jgi:hypothetical protein
MVGERFSPASRSGRQPRWSLFCALLFSRLRLGRFINEAGNNPAGEQNPELT